MCNSFMYGFVISNPYSWSVMNMRVGLCACECVCVCVCVWWCGVGCAVHMCIHALLMYAWGWSRTHTHTHTHTHTCACAHAIVYLCVCECACACVCVYCRHNTVTIHKHRCAQFVTLTWMSHKLIACNQFVAHSIKCVTNSLNVYASRTYWMHALRTHWICTCRHNTEMIGKDRCAQFVTLTFPCRLKSFRPSLLRYMYIYIHIYTHSYIDTHI